MSNRTVPKAGHRGQNDNGGPVLEHRREIATAAAEGVDALQALQRLCRNGAGVDALCQLRDVAGVALSRIDRSLVVLSGGAS